MKKLFFTLIFILLGFAFFSQPVVAQVKTKFMLIVRFKSDFVPPSQDVLMANIKKWQEYMGDLAKTGKLSSGYRPGNEADVINAAKDVKKGPYIANNELISSFIIINAINLEEANAIAKKCPVFEFGGSIEIRSLSETAN